LVVSGIEGLLSTPHTPKVGPIGSPQFSAPNPKDLLTCKSKPDFGAAFHNLKLAQFLVFHPGMGTS
jgi:hypothetical protein